MEMEMEMEMENTQKKRMGATTRLESTSLGFVGFGFLG